MSKICVVALDARHNPTVGRIFCGFDGRMDKPLRVEVMRYRPEPLYFLRLHYKDYALDDDILMKQDGNYETTLRFAKNWVRDELKVEYSSWEPSKASAGGRVKA